MPEIQVPMNVPDLGQFKREQEVREQEQAMLDPNTCWELAYHSSATAVGKLSISLAKGDNIRLVNWGGFLVYLARENAHYTIPFTNTIYVKQFVKEVK